MARQSWAERAAEAFGCGEDTADEMRAAMRYGVRRSNPYDWTRCYICKRPIGRGCDMISLGLPYVSCTQCVYDDPVQPLAPGDFKELAERKGFHTNLITPEGVSMKQALGRRAVGVQEWVTKFWKSGSTDFSVHDVLNWIAAQKGPEFSYAGVRRVCKLMFTATGRGTFHARDFSETGRSAGYYRAKGSPKKPARRKN